MRFRTIFVLLLLFLFSTPGTAEAEEPEEPEAPSQSGSDAAAAELLFQKGRDAMEAGDVEVACENFSESYRLDPAAGTVMNLASCEEKLGRLASAWEHWQRALRLLPEGDRRRNFARSRVQELEAQLPRLTISVAASAPTDLLILRDGTELGRAARGIAIPTDPGLHRITVQAPGYRDRDFEVRVSRGSSKKLEVDVGAPLPKRKATKTAPAAAPRTARTVAFVLGGIGLAGFATAAVTGALLPKKKRTVEANCEDSSRECNEAGLSAARQGRTLLGLNTVGWIVGAVGLGAGAALYFTLGNKENLKAGVSVGDGAQLSISGAF